jgi:prophage regulatory protein
MGKSILTQKPKIYFIKDAEQIVGRNRLTLRRMWQRDEFPKPIKINNRVAWLSSVIDEWLKNLEVSND